MSSRVRLLLGFAVALAALRFVGVPWIDAQANTHHRLFAVTGQLDRAKVIVENGSELQVRRDALGAAVRPLVERAPLAQAGAQHRCRCSASCARLSNPPDWR